MKKIVAILMTIALSFIMTLPVLAADTTETDILPDSMVGTTNLCDVLVLFKRVVNYALAFLAPIAIILMIVGGIFRIIAMGDQKNLAKSNGIIKAAIIGLIIVLLSWTIVTFVIKGLGFDTLAGNWFETISCPDASTTPYDWSDNKKK